MYQNRTGVLQHMKNHVERTAIFTARKTWLQPVGWSGGQIRDLGSRADDRTEPLRGHSRLVTRFLKSPVTVSRNTLVLVALLVFSLAAPATENTPNLAANPGFEDAAAQGVLPAAWSGVPEVYARDTAAAHTGAASLHYTNADPARYVLCSQPVQVEYGRIYEIGVWVRTEALEGDESGATLCMEWYDTEGKYAGGCYPKGLKGTNDWTWVCGTTPRVPAAIASCSLSCYVREGMTGAAWWDDVSVRRVHEDPLQAVLLYPNYRDEMADSALRRVWVRATINLIDYDLEPAQTELTWRLLRGDAVVSEGHGPRVKAGVTDVGIPARALPEGAYEAEVTLADRDTGKALSSKRVAFRRVTQQPGRAVSIDRHNRAIVDGAPFFPLGMYWGTVTKEELDVYADSPFNCLMPYDSPNLEQMDWCRDKGLRVLYSVKNSYFGTYACVGEIKSEADEKPFVEGKVTAFRDHPALLAWYINDELGLELLPRLTERQDQVAALDPGHPTWVVLYQVGEVGKYLPTFDVIGTDPYPIPSGAPSITGEWTRKTVAGVAGARPVWQVPQVFNWANYKETDAEKQACRPPTLEEMRVMAWQCVCEGARGLVFYSWFDLRRDPTAPFETRWPQVKQVAQEIRDTVPFLLSVELPPCIVAAEAPGMSWTIRRLGDTAALFVANPSGESRNAAFRFARAPKAVTIEQTALPIPVVEDGVRFEVPPLSVCTLTLSLADSKTK